MKVVINNMSDREKKIEAWADLLIAKNKEKARKKLNAKKHLPNTGQAG